MDHAHGVGVARAARTLRALANGGQSLSTLAQRGSLGSHAAGLATTSGAHPFICLNLVSVAVVLARVRKYSIQSIKISVGLFVVLIIF